ncbi:MAG: nitroreductase family protein [Bacteroidales bacterium]|nr:nitroreductase family protein [Bacteroidales bacterium]MCB8999360.1 nitroreductase family protein [Bacteroidales bacterium]MCB9013397.1 nitroreductase family protein [Bacteroidales bacterium]
MLDIIKKRRSIRKFTAEKIGQEKINAILEAAMYAPSAANKQPWYFIVIDEPSIMKKIMEVHPHSRMFETASHGILVCGDLNLQHGDGYWLADCGAATQNILLAASSLSIGSCWLGVFPRVERMKAFKELFGLSQQVEVFSLIALGYAAENKAIPERYHPEKVFMNKWGHKKNEL